MEGGDSPPSPLPALPSLSVLSHPCREFAAAAACRLALALGCTRGLGSIPEARSVDAG